MYFWRTLYHPELNNWFLFFNLSPLGNLANDPWMLEVLISLLQSERSPFNFGDAAFQVMKVKPNTFFRALFVFWSDNDRQSNNRIITQIYFYRPDMRKCRLKRRMHQKQPTRQEVLLTEKRLTFESKQGLTLMSSSKDSSRIILSSSLSVRPYRIHCRLWIISLSLVDSQGSIQKS